MSRKKYIEIYDFSFHSFLKRVEQAVLDGYTVSEKGSSAFMGNFQCIMVPTSFPIPEGYLTVAQMSDLTLEDLKEYTKSKFDLTDRSKNSLIYKVVKIYKEQFEEPWWDQ